MSGTWFSALNFTLIKESITSVFRWSWRRHLFSGCKTWLSLMCNESITYEILPPSALAATDGGLVRPVLRTTSTSRYRTKFNLRKPFTSPLFPSVSAILTEQKIRYQEAPRHYQCISYGRRMSWVSLIDCFITTAPVIYTTDRGWYDSEKFNIFSDLWCQLRRSCGGRIYSAQRLRERLRWRNIFR